MNKEEIKKIIEKGENKRVEFKEKFGKETIETTTAFANSDGKQILIGVSNKGKIRGTSIGKETLKDALKDWEFEYKEKKSLTSEDSFLSNIKNIKKKFIN